MRAIRLSSAAVGAIGLVATTLSIAPAANASTFYDPPGSLPSANGALVRTEPMKLGVQLDLGLLSKPLPGTATRIMYKSTDAGGKPVAVSGAYVEPSKAWSGTGPRPLVSLSVGTQGAGDACAPSKSLEKVVNVEEGQAGFGYEIPAVYDFLNRGIAVVVTDYVGLGTTDRVHTYVNRLDMGRSVLDAARAALAVKGASVTKASPIGLYGYSQGGGAAASAAELAPTYAPELAIKGAFAGAPPADLAKVSESADGTSLTAAIGYSVNGILPYDAAAREAADRLLNDAGKKALETVKTQCIGGSIASFAFKKTSTWTKSGKTAAQLIADEPVLKALVDKQRIGRLKPAVPVQVLTGTKDDIVDHAQARQLAVDWCRLGANVSYVPVNQLLSSGGTALNHLTPAITARGPAQRWLVDRLTGKPATSGCATLASQP